MSQFHLPQINQVALSGQLIHDPEFRMTEAGAFRLTFTVAVSRSYRDCTGEWKQDAAHVPVVVWDKLAEFAVERLQKGSGVFLTGRLKSITCETGGNSRNALEVVARIIQPLEKKTEAERETDEEQEPCASPSK